MSPLCVNHRRPNDAHVSVDVCAVEVAIGQICGEAEIDMPVRLGSFRVISIEGVDTVVDDRHVNNIVFGASNSNTRDLERLPVDLVIQNALEEQSELFHVHIRRSQDGLIQIRVGAGIVIVRCQHVHLPERDRHSEQLS